MHYRIGPTGPVVRGSVLDVNRSSLERALRAYDSLLYLVWNPKKRHGMGCWEIRRRPEKKSVVHQATWNGHSFLELKYVELDVVHHVLDVPVLGYHVLKRIQEMDAWNIKDWVNDLEYREAKHREQYEDLQREETRYMIKQHRREINDLKEMLLSGVNPARIANEWGRS